MAVRRVVDAVSPPTACAPRTKPLDPGDPSLLPRGTLRQAPCLSWKPRAVGLVRHPLSFQMPILSHGGGSRARRHRPPVWSVRTRNVNGPSAMSIAISRKATTISNVRVRRRLPTATANESGHFTGVLRKVWTSTSAGLRCKWVVARGDSQECSEE